MRQRAQSVGYFLTTVSVGINAHKGKNMQTLAKRPCQIGGSINGRTEKHGEEPVPCMDITIEMLITAQELNELMGEPHTADAWFENGGNKLPEPLLKHLQPYKLKGKFEGSAASILVGLQLDEIELPTVTIASCVFEPKVGGMTALKCKLQTKISRENLEIFLWMGREADVELRFGLLAAGDDQGELQLEMGGKDSLEGAIAADDEDQQKAEIEKVIGKDKPKRRRRAATGDALN